MRLTFVLSASLVLGGCLPIPCDFPVRCVDSCDTRREVSFMCGACPAGSVPISTCLGDAGVGEDAPSDAAARSD